MWTISLVLIALSLGGVMEKIAILDVIVNKMTRKVKRTGSIMSMTIVTSIFASMATAAIYFSLVLNGRLYKKKYKEMGLHKTMLTRAIEEGATMADPLIPWTTTGIFTASMLGVEALEYIPYSFNNLITPVLSITCCYLGFSIIKDNEKGEEEFSKEQI
jgi:NhaC family Na+:H+ antiporter